MARTGAASGSSLSTVGRSTTDSENTFEFTPTKEGEFIGRCAELCGAYHSRMLFDVDVVSTEEYDDYLRSFVDYTESLVVGNPFDAGTDIGPMVSAARSRILSSSPRSSQTPRHWGQ